MTVEEYVESCAVRVPIHMHWGDVDASYALGASVYFRYLEAARIEYFRGLGCEFTEQRTGPVLGSISCEFLHSVRYGEELLGTARLLTVGKDRLFLENCIVSLTHRHISVRGEATMFAFDFSLGTKVPLPKPWCCA
jgi:acyl-CoA thioester hydrolase